MAEAIYINGKWRGTASGGTKRINNPATGEVVEEIGYGSGAEAGEAAAAAAEAFEEWSQRSVYERAALLRKLSDAIRDNAEELSRTLTMEVGKPLREAAGEIGAGADQVEWYAEEVKRSAGDVIPNRLANRRHLTIRHPVGPVAAISPWNFPMMLSLRKIAPALAAGCTVVCRPASQAPLTIRNVFRLIDEIGFPPGVANLVTGDAASCSKEFVDDARIKKISFTGSLDVGRELAAACARKMKKITLELGGSSPFVVMPDVAPGAAAETAVFAKFRNMGQVCISASRFIVPNAIKKEFERLAAELASAIKLGNGLDPKVDSGPLFDAKRVAESERFVADIEAKGGRILCGGKRPEGAEYEKGSFFLPTVATDMKPEMLIMKEEPFSPILPVIGYDDVDEAIRIANDTRYGLAAYAMTNDLKYTIKLAEKLEAGIIGINDCSPAAAQCPFGGMKDSGSGREGWRQGLEGYYEVKYISIGI